MKITIKKIGLESKDQLIRFDKSFEIIDDLNHRYDWSFEDGTCLLYKAPKNLLTINTWVENTGLRL